MKIIICPGIHPQKLTDNFVANLEIDADFLVLPTQEYLPYSAWDIYRWLEKQLSDPSQITENLLFIAFSAGVVGGLGAAIAWQMKVGNIRGFFAIDGWGVPLVANFPLYRLSHDYFTHWSSAMLGRLKHSFYCDPPVEHLDLWRSPDTAWGWYVVDNSFKIRCSAATYLQNTIAAEQNLILD
jgi:hypothetical protein